MNVADTVLALAALPVAAACGYLGLLTVFSKRTSPSAARSSRSKKFDFVVPAHNEEDGIARTVQNLLTVDWPKEQFRVVVIADNCSDATAVRAEAAGARVLVRHNAELRGKGYALEYAFETLLAEGFADAVVVIDADTVVSPGLLEGFAVQLEAGELAAQADNAVHNRDASWRTRLMSIALGMFHILRSQGRERLGVSCGVRGNGICLSREALKTVPHKVFSVVEDLEYGIRLAEAGIRVAYAGDSHVYSDMVTSEKASRSQRQRWEGGRAQMAKRYGFPLLKKGMARRSPMLLDLALDVLVPPLSTLVSLVGLIVVLAGVLHVFHAPAPLSLAVSAFMLVCLGAYVLRGWWLSGSGARGLLDLAFAPAYIVWKLGLKLRGSAHRRGEWVRTAREHNNR